MRFENLRIWFACLGFALILSTTASYAQDRHDSSSYPRHLALPLAQSHTGDSPFAPPSKNDQTFVVDTGSGLDTGCTFASGGPLIITFQVDRVVGDIDKLLANGLIEPTATLDMPAYDVDYYTVAPGYNSERDIVKINGHTVDSPSEYLTGLDNTWVMNRFNIPVKWLNFPTDPGAGNAVVPVDNTIEIDIDTANTSDVWCTSIDWAATTIQVARPVVMVHGILRDLFGNPWTSQWVPGLSGLGLPNSGSLDMGNLDSIENNASKIASEVSADKKRWGVDAVNLVTHSKGGIDSRQYAETSTSLEQLIQIATPNAGTPLADYFQKLAVKNIGQTATSLINALMAPAGIQLTTGYMDRYNSTHGHNSKVSYDSLAGLYEPVCPTINPIEAGLCWFSDKASAENWGEGDTVVPVMSVFSLPYSSHLQFPASSPYHNFDATHFGQTGSYSIFQKLLPNVQQFGTPVSSEARQRFLVQHENAIRTSQRSTNLQASSSAPTQGSTFSQVGEIHQSATATGTITVDSSDSVTFALFYASGTLDLTLTSPSGAVYTPSSANGSSVSYENDDIPGGRMVTYALSNPATGAWTYKITGTSVTDPSGFTAYSIDALLKGSQIAMTVGFSSSNLHLNDSLLIEATVTNAGSPLTGATATAIVKLPDATASTITLFDDGTHGDVHSGDGIYSAAFAQTVQSGNYQVVFQVKGTSPAFEREGYALATVSSSNSSFSGTFTDAGIDSDSDGLYNSLDITVGVTIAKAANYRVYGEITDSQGNVLDTTVESKLSTSDSTVQLYFDGATLYQRGVDGPYKLTRVTMAEDDGTAIMPVDEKLNAYQTTPYKASQFQHSGLAVTGNGTSKGIDLNGNKLFDQLVIDFDVTSAGSGSYNWSGLLSDKNGTAISLAANSGNLNAGTNTIELVFDGKAIGTHGVNGPYQLNDLLLYGPGGSISVGHVLNTTAYLASQFEGFTALNPINTGVSLALTGPPSGSPTYGDNVSVTALVQPTTGTGVPTGAATFTLDGAAQAPVSIVNGRATFTLALGGGKHTFSATYSGDIDYASSASSSSLVVTVAPAASTTSLALSASTITIQDTATFTAQIGSAVTSPVTGTVTFSKINSDNTLTSLGTGTVGKDSNGNYTAILSGQSFAIGTYTLQAAYSGDANFTGSASAKVTLTVTDKADLTLTNAPTTISLSFGGSGTATASLTAVNGFNAPITLACSGLSSDLSCILSATNVTAASSITIKPDSNGAYPSSVQIAVSSTAKAALEPPASGNRVALAVLFPFLFVPFLLPVARMRRKLTGILMIAVAVAAIGAITGCGGGGRKPETETATGTITLTSSGSHPINHVYSFTINVK